VRRDGIGHRVPGGCLCDLCRYIVEGQLRAVLARVPRERRAELLAAVEKSLADDGENRWRSERADV